MSAPDLGPFNLGRTDVDDIEAVATNFALLRDQLGVSRVVATSQVHGADVLVVDENLLAHWDDRAHLGAPGGGRSLPVADAMVTALPDVALCIRVADCVPVLFADAERGVLGAAHAGREGYLSGVVGTTLQAMRDLGAEQIVAWIGPHICGACYEVPEQMASDVAVSHPQAVARTSWGTPSLDLGRGVEAELLAEGVEVQRLDPCTRTTPDLHSHRRDAGRAGRLAGVIWRH